MWLYNSIIICKSFNWQISYIQNIKKKTRSQAVFKKDEYLFQDLYKDNKSLD